MPKKIIEAVLPRQDEIKELFDQINGLRYNLFYLKEGKLKKCKFQLGIELDETDCSRENRPQQTSDNSKTQKEKNMKNVNLIVFGADSLAKQLDDIDHLVTVLRRKLIDLDAKRLELEAHLNHVPTNLTTDSEEAIE